MTMQRKTLLITLAATATLAGLLAWAFAPRPVAVEIAEAASGVFETSIDEDARTRVRDRFVVSAPLSGQLDRVLLREGDAVEAGAALATLTPAMSPMLDARSLNEQRARIGAAEANLQRALTRIGAARVGVEQAAINMRRTSDLARQGFVAPTRVDSDRLAVQAAQRELETAVEGEHVARHELEQARAALLAVQDSGTAGARGSQGFVIRAPVAGRVLKLHQTSATPVLAGAALLEIGDTRRMDIVAELLTSDALLARPGTPVRIERWGGPVILNGRVQRVEPAAFTKVSALGVEEQRVRVVIEIASDPAEWTALGDGYRVGVRIVTRNEPAAVRVPVSAVFPLPAGSAGTPAGSAVFVLDAGRARLRPVTIGGRNGSHAWIQQGLAAGDKVIVYPPATVQDGARVQARSV